MLPKLMDVFHKQNILENELGLPTDRKDLDAYKLEQKDFVHTLNSEMKPASLMDKNILNSSKNEGRTDKEIMITDMAEERDD